MEVIINSDLFCQFLKSGVKNLKEANVVNPRRTKRQNRMSFLGRVKGEDKAEVRYLLGCFECTHSITPFLLPALLACSKEAIGECAELLSQHSPPPSLPAELS